MYKLILTTLQSPVLFFVSTLFILVQRHTPWTVTIHAYVCVYVSAVKICILCICGLLKYYLVTYVVYVRALCMCVAFAVMD